MTSIDRLTDTVRNGLSLRVTKAMHDNAITALDELAALAHERDEAVRLRGVATEWAAELAGKKRAAEARVSELEAKSERQATNIGALYRQRVAAQDRVSELRDVLEEIASDAAASWIADKARAALAADRTEERPGE